MRTLSGCTRRRCLLTCLVISCLATAPGGQAVAEYEWANRFPKVTLTTQDGEEVEFYRDLVKDKIVIINFMYTTCTGLCAQATKTLEQIQDALGEQLGKEVFIYSITLEPDVDTPEVLKEYAKAHGAKPGWTFLTGKAGDIEALRESLGLSNRDEQEIAQLGLPDPQLDAEPGQRDHTEMIAIGYDAFNRWHNESIRSSPEQILQMLERLKPPKRSPQ